MIHELVSTAAPGMQQQQLGEMGRVTERGFKMREIIQSASTDTLDGLQLMVWLL